MWTDWRTSIYVSDGIVRNAIFYVESLTRTVFGFVGTCRVTVELASCRYLGWARFVRSSATLRSSPRVKVVVLRTMRVTMRFVPFSPRLDVFVDSIDEPEQRERAIENVDREGNRWSEQRFPAIELGKEFVRRCANLKIVSSIVANVYVYV